MTKLHYKTLFISDTHLGTSTARAERLLHFLKNVEMDELYLVGDIIDLLAMKRKWYWPKEHNDVVRRILKLAAKGVKVVYIPGNHDDKVRDFLGINIGGIEIKPYDIYQTDDGRKLLVTHGDQFDLVVMNSPYLSFFGGMAYNMLIKVNRCYNSLLAKLGMPEMSLSQKIKSKTKTVCQFISDFENLLANQARKFGVDGVICGHIHRAEINLAGFDGVQYYNCGDWVESCTCLGEDSQGEINLLDYSELIDECKISAATAEVKNHDMVEEAYVFDPEQKAALNILMSAATKTS